MAAGVCIAAEVRCLVKRSNHEPDVAAQCAARRDGAGVGAKGAASLSGVGGGGQLTQRKVLLSRVRVPLVRDEAAPQVSSHEVSQAQRGE